MKPHILLSHDLHSSPAASKVGALAAVAEPLGFSHERPDCSAIGAAHRLSAQVDYVAQSFAQCVRAL